MVGQTTSWSNDRSRTYWTAAMERYFIDLMLEQMQRGARIGHTFNKQAWIEMLAMFNDNFGSQYDKEVLKSRYTNLWKQFNDVKNLLGQSGFAWDEARQMVVADDYLWDSYIKAHPDARSYKTKPVLNFSDLCMIYGYTNADGRYSRSSHDVDFDDELQGANIGGDGTLTLDPSSNGRQRTDWTHEMDQYLVELMLDQVGRGNKVGNTFNKDAWNDMLALFNAKFGSQHGKRVLRHRHKKLSKYCSDVTFILKHDGFCWNETQRMVEADDHVWNTYINAHSHARVYRTKALPNYSDMMLIFGDEFGNALNPCSNKEKNFEDVMVQQVILTGEGKESQASNVGDRTRTYWTPPMDLYLLDLLQDQVHRGNKLVRTFISQAWTDMATLFNARFRTCHDKDVLKNRYKHMRRQYNDIKQLLGQSGFSWDEARERIVAEDRVWDSYTKAHPDARAYRVKTVPGFHKLCDIFGGEHFGAKNNILAHNKGVVDIELPTLTASLHGEESNERIDTELSEMVYNDPCFKMISDYHQFAETSNARMSLDICVPDEPKRRFSLESLRSDRNLKVQKTETESVQSISEMAELVEELVSQNEKTNENVTKSAIDALVAVGDMEDELLLDACDLLEEERKAKTFLALDPALRKKWLLRKLRP